MAKFEVEIGGNIDGLAKSVDAASNKLKQFDSTTSSLNGLATGSNKAGFALTNLGRVAQDAPFGFIGIQNNLNPLLESFQQLTKETGSTGGALKALGQSLIGPAGIGIALSVVSSAFILYQQYQQKAAKETEALNKQTQDYAKSLQQTNQVLLKGQQNAQQELVTLDLLYKAATNLTLSQKQRLSAADQLQKQFPETFKNYTDEQIILGQVGKAYEDLSAKILANAKARAGVDFLVENAKKELLLQTRINNAKEAETRALNERKLAQSILSQGNVEDTKAAQQKLLITKLTNSLVEKGAEDIGKIGFLQIELNKLKKEDLKIATLINGEIAKGATLGDKNNDLVGDKLNKAKVEIEPRVSIKPISPDILLNTFQQFNALKGLEAPLNIKIKPVLTVPENVFSDAKLKILQSLEDIRQQVDAIINNGLNDTFSSIGEGIGQALINGGSVIDAAGGALLQSLGSVLSQLGKAAIAAGVAALGIQTVLKNPLNPGAALAAIAGGIALTAVGAILGGLGRKVSASGGGSNVSVPQAGRGGSSNVSSGFSGSGGGMSSGEVVFKIYGSDLIGVLNRAGAKLQTYKGP